MREPCRPVSNNAARERTSWQREHDFSRPNFRRLKPFWAKQLIQFGLQLRAHLTDGLFAPPNQDMESESGTVRAKIDSGQDLAARILAGDRDAEEELCNAYRRRIQAFAAVRTGDYEAARDLAQEILISVLKAVREGQLREAEKLSAFVQGTARNLINNYKRTKARRAEFDLESVPEPSADPVERIESADQLRRIREELDGFRPIDQQILLLSLVDGLSLLEVAQRLDLSHDAVRARRSRMIRKITKKFARLSHK